MLDNKPIEQEQAFRANRRWVRGQNNVSKMHTLKCAAYNFGLLLRKVLGCCKPRNAAVAGTVLFRVLDVSVTGSDSSRSGNEHGLALVVGYLRVVNDIAGGKPQRSIHPRMSEKVPFFNALLRRINQN